MVTEITDKILLLKGIPPSIHSIILDNSYHSNITYFSKTIATLINSDKVGGLFISGGAGSGKTTLGCYAVTEVLKTGKSARRVAFSDFKSSIESHYGQIENKYSLDHLVFIDDITLCDLGRHDNRIIQFIKTCIDYKIKVILSGNRTARSPDVTAFLKSAFYPIDLGADDLRQKEMLKYL